MNDFFSRFLDTSDFPPRWYCGNWSDFLGWLHVGSDIAIFAAYFAIPAVLVYFARKRSDFPFTRLFWLFGGFIFACGTVHLVEAIIFWHPIYRVSGLVKLVTAIISWTTVIALGSVIPKVIHLPSLAANNERLEREIAERLKTETDLRAAQKELAQQKRELELIYEAAPVGMSLIDLQYRFLRVNQTFTQINGQSKEAHLGRRIDELLPGICDQLLPIYASVFETAQPVVDIEIVGEMRASGGTRTWLSSYFPLGLDGTKSDETVSAVSAIFQDITDRKTQEQRLIQSERAALAANQSKSEFLANMSHEIRTPMAAILGYADVLLGHLNDPDNRNCVLIIKRNGKYLLELINDILDLSRIEANKLEIDFEACDLHQLVADIRSLMHVRASEKNLTLEIRFDTPVPPTITTDAIRLRQILINLLGNAIKFTESGSVILSVGLVPYEFNDGRIEFAVIDTGIGISPEQQTRLFKPFSQGDTSVTRRYGGSGLGLAISERLTNLLGGKLTVQSELGNGSTFRVQLPVGDIDATKLVQPVMDEELPERLEVVTEARQLACRVLVVDDRRDVRHISQHFLEKAGATVATAENGEQAIESATSAQDAGQPFDVIVMDMQMPKVDGLQATAHLRSAGIDWPIIALTADAMKGDRERCLSGGCDDYLSKPIDHAALVEMVGHYSQDVTMDELRRRRRERAAALKATL